MVKSRIEAYACKNYLLWIIYSAPSIVQGRVQPGRPDSPLNCPLIFCPANIVKEKKYRKESL